MYIKRIEIDGFKSYAQKQVVDQFDSMFNAITGLNGTGKSNILDSICFVLGITNLTCIRAGQMNDLVYKQGQAGINKATVTITFDNSDKNQSPLGYKEFKEIVVRRQVIVNGRNTYTVNGTAATVGKVADFFRSVGLNVNNPHFLIMQGRITKVLNMKPPEILGMLEEAAGTKMYDAKRDLAVAMIKKKQVKVDEIEKALNEDILPTVEKLKQERADYLEFTKSERDINDLERKKNAYVYRQSQIEEKNSYEAANKTKKEVVEVEQKIADNRALVETGQAEYQEMEEKKAGQNSGEKTGLDTRMKELNSALAKTESDRDAVKDERKKLDQETARLKKGIDQDKEDLKKKRKDLKSLEEDKGGDEQKGDDAKERVERARTHLNAVMQGMTTDDTGKAVTVEAQINQAKEQLLALSANIKAAQTREKQVRPELNDKKKELSNLSRQQTDEGREVDGLEGDKKKVESDLARIRFDEQSYFDLQRRQRELHQERQQMDMQLQNMLRRTNVNFNYNRRVLPPTFDESKVLGMVIRHLGTHDKKFNLSLEVAAGGALFQVIVTELAVAKAMVNTKDCLPNRTTFIALDVVQPRVADRRILEAAKAIAANKGEQCWLAVDLITYTKDFEPAMQHLFGNTIICESKESASAICYDQRCKIRTVTLDGDMFQPSGTGSGGQRDKGHSPIAVSMSIQETEKENKEKIKEYEGVEAELRQLEPLARQYSDMKNRLNEVTDRLAVLRDNLKNSPVQILKNEIADLEKELPELEARIKEGQAKAKELHEKVRTYEDRKKNAKQFKEQEEKKAKKELKEAEAALAALGASVEKSKEMLATRREEVDALEKAISEQEEQIQENERKMGEANERYKEKEEAVAAAKEQVNAGKGDQEAFRSRMKAHDEEMKKLEQRTAKLEKEMKQLENKKEDLKKSIVEVEEEAKKYHKQWKAMRQEHGWLKDLDDGNDELYDFTDYVYSAEKKRLDDLKARVDTLGRTLNKKAMNILGSAEENVMNLLKKRDQLELDKKTILDTIEQLDEKKKQEVLKAHQQVTKDFGNIFTTLLPGTSAKLEPPAGKTALDGLEVKVAFNGKWKESLGELSGGQRSLVALSLVLAMLKFKPAPLYILDEVDAALDLSHTQNIGAMIKKHFKNSQFIIVSLKEGMFNHANVLFKTRFQDGTSQVMRFVNSVDPVK